MSSRVYIATSGIVQSDGTISLTFPDVPAVGTVWTGSVNVYNAVGTEQWMATVSGQPWAKFNGVGAMQVQLTGREQLGVTASNLSPGVIYNAVFMGSADTEGTVPYQGPPSAPNTLQNVGINGNVTVDISNTPSVIVSSGTIDVGNTPAVTISSGTVDISNIAAGTVDIGTVGSIIEGSTSETQETVDATSVVPAANTSTSISPAGTLGTYIRVGIISIYSAASSGGTVLLENGAGVIFFYVGVPDASTPGPWTFPINHNVFNSSPGGIFVTTSVNPIRVTITHNVNMTVHA